VDELDFGVWSNQPCDTEFEMSVDVERAARVFAQLRKDYQQVIELALLEGLSHAQIASKLGMPLGSVKSCMRRGLLQVRQLLSGPSESETGSLGG
jgi:RNA polymerase sigma-70 factor (ECF subfamily)